MPSPQLRRFRAKLGIRAKEAFERLLELGCDPDDLSAKVRVVWAATVLDRGSRSQRSSARGREKLEAAELGLSVRQIEALLKDLRVAEEQIRVVNNARALIPDAREPALMDIPRALSVWTNEVEARLKAWMKSPSRWNRLQRQFVDEALLDLLGYVRKATRPSSPQFARVSILCEAAGRLAPGDGRAHPDQFSRKALEKLWRERRSRDY